MTSSVTITDVRRARERFDPDIVRETPVERSRSLSEMSGADVRLKMEHLQRTGSFKTRGASNKLHEIVEAGEGERSEPSERTASDASREHGDAERVVAASAGNHAQGVALAASNAGIPAVVVMPEDAPQAKVDATRGYGAEVVLHGREFQAAVAHARDLAEEPGSVFVHAYDDPAIVAGQGTLGLEVAEQVPDLDTVIVPIGGGGLIGGVATALASVAPEVRVVGVQAEDAATVPDSLDKGEPVDREHTRTIADGIATGGVADLTYDLIERHVDEVVTVSDDEIAHAILTLLQRAKQLVEGAGAASVAGLLSGRIDVADETVVPLLCGGNIDMSMLDTVLEHAMTDRDQLLRLRVRIEDEPGELSTLSTVLADRGANVRHVRHDRAVEDLRVGEAYLVFEVAASGREHAGQLLDAIRDRDYEVDRIN
ncbi:threonine ammonia-lyase [Halobaculum sp. WSA2]|uniref:threonine ammonia-lyase n=1 Tax=Halobaculum saliterrae TaxID=2073113 RepID=A0A6B0SRQ0_9EURY|nr:threonine ammonia-lyase [Halobaculum saliterrae]MXR40246.1 threonine ammonia-lyase [Halobaculum saliterrae]